MSKITTQDCYLLTGARSGDGSYEKELSFMLKDKFLEKKSGMVCLTKEDFEKAIGDAFDAGKKYGIIRGNNVLQLAGKLPNKTEYINSII